MQVQKPNCDILFEISWEVCNKVGGIYTVVMSKASLMKALYKNYFLIGPYMKDQAKLYFQEQEIPKQFEEIFKYFDSIGVKLYYGEWEIEGTPKVILIDHANYMYKSSEIKTKLWDLYKIDSLYSNDEFNNPCVWSWLAGMLIEQYYIKNPNKKIVVHSHEWLSGFANLYLKSLNIKVGTVFLTHATILGRTLAGAGMDLYNILDSLNPEEMARKFSVQDKHTTEVACAKNSDIFATVSEITALEAEKIIGKKPDILLLNGLDMSKFPSFEELTIKHRKAKENIFEFIKYYFFPYYFFDLNNTLIFFIVGRYEYKNKGIDIFTKALVKLNNRLKQEKSKKTIVTFFWIPRDVTSAKMELSESKIRFEDIEEFIEKNLEDIKSNILNNIISCDSKNNFENEISKNLFNEDFVKKAKILNINFRREGTPLLSTHNMIDEHNDIILNTFIENGLDNKEDDNVKVIFYPVYLSGIDGMLDMPYYDAMLGCHLGLFPSYYEPWGYTPMECAALGIPSLTTDFGGFGRFVLSRGKGEKGIYVLKRTNRTEEEVVEEFSNLLYNFAKMERQVRFSEKLMAKEIASYADWNDLVYNYVNAHNLALERIERVGR